MDTLTEIEKQFLIDLRQHLAKYHVLARFKKYALAEKAVDKRNNVELVELLRKAHAHPTIFNIAMVAKKRAFILKCVYWRPLDFRYVFELSGPTFAWANTREGQHFWEDILINRFRDSQKITTKYFLR